MVKLPKADEEAKIQILLHAENESVYFQITESANRSPRLQTQIHWSRSYEQTSREAKKKKYDLIIFDADSTATTGNVFEFLSFRKSERVSLPVIVISDGKSKDDGLKLLRAGAADFLVRGLIKPDFLVRSITYACERSKQQLKNFAVERELLREQKISALGSLATNIGYELGTHLEKIEDELSLIRTDNPAIEKVFESLEHVRSSKKVINLLLAFASPQISVLPNIDLKKLIVESVEILNQAAGSQVRVISLIDSSQEFRADINPNEIKQALTNLVLNAKEAMDELGGLITVKLSVLSEDSMPASLRGKAQNAYAKISVIDQGTGIAPEKIARLFEPNFTAKNSLKGFGLGLNMVLSICRAHQGELLISSEIGQGATFEMLLPLNAVRSAETPDYRGLVMVIESNPNLMEVCKLYFSAASLESRVFESLEAGIEWYTDNSHKVDLVMLASPEYAQDIATLQLLNSISPDLNLVIAGDCPYNAEQQAELAIKRVVPEENKYLATISWVGEGIECCQKKETNE